MQLKKIMVSLTTTLFVTAGFLVVPVAPVSADVTIDQENVDTGFRSRNRNRERIRENRRDRIRNHARVNNRVRVRGNTGDNKSNKNTNGGSLTSGAVDGAIGLMNHANENAGEMSCPEHDGDTIDVTQLNDTTGARSHNTNDARISRRSSCHITNRANIRNNVRFTGKTGNNEQKQNTNAGDLTSGDVVLTLDIANHAN